MSRVDELHAELAVAELEQELVDLKDSADGEQLRDHKQRLRYARWVHRGGPAEEAALLAADGVHSNRAVAELYQRWLAENPEG